MSEVELGVDGYTVVELIGRGGFGAVYRVSDDAHGREVAVKVLPATLDESARRQFDRERRAMGVLSDHPGIGTVHTSGFTKNGEPFIAMQLMSGGSLAERIAQGPLAVSEALGIGALMADALDAAHARGVLHLDIKPENILFTSRGEPKLVDFGIAKLADDTRSTSTIRATPAYAAPEVLEGETATPAADVYSLGVTLFAALMGHAPFSGDSMLTVLRRIAVEPVPEITRPDVPPPVVALLRSAMDKSPGGRPPSMAAFAEQLRRLQSNVDTTAAPAADDQSGRSTVTFASAPLNPSGQVPPVNPSGQTPGAPSGQFPAAPSGQFPGAPSSQFPGAPSGQFPGAPSGQFAPPGSPTPSGQFPGANPTPQGWVAPGGTPPPVLPGAGVPPGNVPSGPHKKRSMGPIIGGIAAAVIALVVAAVLVTRGGDDGDDVDALVDTTEQTEETQPSTTAPRTVATLDTLPPTTIATTTLPPSTLAPTTSAPGTGTGTALGFVDTFVWGTELDDQQRAIPSGSYFGDGTMQMCLSWVTHDYSGGLTWEIKWRINGVERTELGGSGTTVGGEEPYYACVFDFEAGLESGVFEIEFWIDGERQISDALYVAGGRFPSTQKLINQVGVPLCAVQISPNDADVWGLNRAGETRIPINGDTTVTLASGLYDIRALDCNGTEVFSQFGVELSGDGDFFIVPN